MRIPAEQKELHKTAGQSESYQECGEQIHEGFHQQQSRNASH